jgi:hypothetical protein
LSPTYGYVRITQFQEHSGENLVSALKDLQTQNKGSSLKGLVLDLRNDPGGLLNTAVSVSGAFLKPNDLVVYTDGRTEDAKMRLTNSRENYLRPGESDYLKNLPAWTKKVPWLCWSMAAPPQLLKSSPARCRITSAPWSRHADLRQRLGANHPAAQQRHRHQAHHRALLHPERPQHSGQRHYPGHHRRRCHHHQ